MVVFLPGEKEQVGAVSISLMFLQLLPLFAAAALTERALKKEFG